MRDARSSLMRSASAPQSSPCSCSPQDKQQRVLMVKRLHPSITMQLLLQTFGCYGTITGCKVFTHKSGRSAGCASLEFANHQAACTTLHNMQHAIVHGKTIDLQWFSPSAVPDSPPVRQRSEGISIPASTAGLMASPDYAALTAAAAGAHMAAFDTMALAAAGLSPAASMDAMQHMAALHAANVPWPGSPSHHEVQELSQEQLALQLGQQQLAATAGLMASPGSSGPVMSAGAVAGGYAALPQQLEALRLQQQACVQHAAMQQAMQQQAMQQAVQEAVQQVHLQQQLQRHIAFQQQHLALLQQQQHQHQPLRAQSSLPSPKPPPAPQQQQQSAHGSTPPSPHGQPRRQQSLPPRSPQPPVSLQRSMRALHVQVPPGPQQLPSSYPPSASPGALSVSPGIVPSPARRLNLAYSPSSVRAAAAAALAATATADAAATPGATATTPHGMPPIPPPLLSPHRAALANRSSPTIFATNGSSPPAAGPSEWTADNAAGAGDTRCSTPRDTTPKKTPRNCKTPPPFTGSTYDDTLVACDSHERLPGSLQDPLRLPRPRSATALHMLLASTGHSDASPHSGTGSGSGKGGVAAYHNTPFHHSSLQSIGIAGPQDTTSPLQDTKALVMHCMERSASDPLISTQVGPEASADEIEDAMHAFAASATSNVASAVLTEGRSRSAGMQLSKQQQQGQRQQQQRAGSVEVWLGQVALAEERRTISAPFQMPAFFGHVQQHEQQEERQQRQVEGQSAGQRVKLVVPPVIIPQHLASPGAQSAGGAATL